MSTEKLVTPTGARSIGAALALALMQFLFAGGASLLWNMGHLDEATGLALNWTQFFVVFVVFRLLHVTASFNEDGKR